MHLLFGLNKLLYRIAEHFNSKVTRALSSSENECLPGDRGICNLELWSLVYPLIKT